MPEQPLRVAVANDYEIVVEGLAAMLSRFDDIDPVDLMISGDAVSDEPIDVVLYDTFGREGVFADLLTTLLATPTMRHVAVFTLSWTNSMTHTALERGVSGVLSKGLTGSALAASLRQIADGQVVVLAPDRRERSIDTGRDWPGRAAKLSERESEVVVLLAQGLRNQEIAEVLDLSEDTIKTHLKRTYRKLGVANRAQATNVVLSHPDFRVQRNVTFDRSPIT